ncbi:MAG TPA: VOC family protein [Alphaproteobacteria bacterium]|nr:VOC family protein [Alphaproteobacteria bacterium]
MKPGRGIDHLVLCVRSLDAAREAYARMGFTLTPPAQHPWGTGNSLVQLQGNFLELLAVVDEKKMMPPGRGEFAFGLFNQAFLERREGFSMLVFASDDARRDQAEFAGAGLQTYAPFEFSRKAKLPGGDEVTVGFSLAFVTDPRMPEAAFFVCQQHAPQHFWKPDYQRHANGALAVSEVVMRAEEPALLAELFIKLQGRDAVSAGTGQLLVNTARGRVAVLDPRGAAERFGDALPRGPQSPHFIAYRITVADIGKTKALLDDAGLAYRAQDGALQIAAKDAFGTVLEFAA